MDGGTEIATRLHRFTVGDYYRMGEVGMLDDLRVELIRGTIVDMAPIGSPHSWTIMRLTRLFAPVLLDERAHISVQNPLRLNNYSEPEPDVALLSWNASQTMHPGPGDALLVIEVADSSLGFDRATKRPLYADAGIRDYWIVNLVDRVIEMHREPGLGDYEQVTRVAAGMISPLALPRFEIAVADVFPPVS